MIAYVMSVFVCALASVYYIFSVVVSAGFYFVFSILA